MSDTTLKIKKTPRLAIAGAIALIIIIVLLGRSMFSGVGSGWSLWILTVSLLAAGGAVLSWSKAPAFAKSVASLMVGGGTLLMLFLLLFGTSAVEYRKNQLEALVAGQTETTSVPLSPTKQAQRLQRAEQDGDLAAVEARKQADAREAERRALMEPEVRACSEERWASHYPKCELVIFTHPDQIHQRRATSDKFCVYAVPTNVTQEPITQPGVFEYKPGNTGRGSVEIFDLPLGKTFNNFTCGG